MDWSRIRVVYGSTAISEAPSDPFFDKLARKGEGTIQVGLLFSGRRLLLDSFLRHSRARGDRHGV